MKFFNVIFVDSALNLSTFYFRTYYQASQKVEELVNQLVINGDNIAEEVYDNEEEYTVENNLKYIHAALNSDCINKEIRLRDKNYDPATILIVRASLKLGKGE